MGFDMDGTLKDMAQAALDAIQGDIPGFNKSVDEVLEDSRQALANIAHERLLGNITDADVQRHLCQEGEVFKAGLRMLSVQSKVALQKACDAAWKVFLAAVKAVL